MQEKDNLAYSAEKNEVGIRKLSLTIRLVKHWERS